MYKILIVDDEHIIRSMLEEELQEKYRVFTAIDGSEALNLCKKESFDLVLSDINMPGIKGPDLLYQIKTNYPSTKTVLMTSYNIDDYIRMAKDYRISNIMPKTTPFNFDELSRLVENLTAEEIFGIKKYLKPEVQIIKTYEIKSSTEVEKIEDEIVKIVEERYGKSKFLKMLLEEIISNAIYHAPMVNDHEKYEKHSEVNLEPTEYVDVEFACDDEKYAIAIVDKSGKLTTRTILYKLDRHIHADGLFDEDGRGLHMSRIYSDRLIINIKPNLKTEIIIINYTKEKYKGFKPLYINEL